MKTSELSRIGFLLPHGQSIFEYVLTIPVAFRFQLDLATHDTPYNIYMKSVHATACVPFTEPFNDRAHLFCCAGGAGGVEFRPQK